MVALVTIYHPPGAPSGPMLNHIVDAGDKIISQLIRAYPLKQIVHLPTRGHLQFIALQRLIIAVS